MVFIFRSLDLLKPLAFKGCVPFNQLNLNPDCTTENLIFFPFRNKTDLILTSEQSTSIGGGSFRLVSESGFRLYLPFGELGSDQ